MAHDNYLDIDFTTFVESMKTILKAKDTFKDYNFEGSNISVLLELLAYQMELNTYYQNKIAKNVYLESADLYDTVHRLARQKGYYPKGYISATATITVTLSGGYSPGDQVYVPAYSSVSTEDGISYLTTVDHTFNIPASASALSYSIDLDVKEGELETLTYTGEDLVDLKIIMPEKNFDNDDNDSNDHESIKVLVNSTKWSRLDNFYENLTGVTLDEDVYTFDYTKDESYTVTFSNTRNFPSDTDDITVYVIISSGPDGAVGANTLTTADSAFVENLTTGSTIALENISVTNASASTAGSLPETVSEIRESANDIFNSQYRLVTKQDFRAYLETRTDVEAASVWGEQEETLNGNVQEYNKVHITVIPKEWGSGTISQTTSAWVPTWDTDKTINIELPDSFNSTFQSTLSSFIEPRKILNAFEVYELPELLYFYMELGLRVRSTYNFANVSNAIKNKLIYYFDAANRKFNETIDFRDIIDYIVDTTETSSTDDFTNVAGIRSLTFRDIYLTTTVWPYESKNYPRYTLDEFDMNTDNILRPIELGFKQFPAINENLITILNEG